MTDNKLDSRFLLAVSGGADSMCLASLFYMAGFADKITLAHVNFKLRGEESDGDERFVEKWCEERGVKFFKTSFDTYEYAHQQSISTQMAARDLRYSWFEKLMHEGGYDYLAVAHNLNDTAETLFINLLRGTGIKGLGGISEVNGSVIRPIMIFTRAEIELFMKENGFPYRTDRTNSENHYSRNKIRNLVFPVFETINPSFLQTIGEEISIFSQVHDVVTQRGEEIKKRVMRCFHPKNCSADSLDLSEKLAGKVAEINFELLLQELHPSLWLFNFLQPFGFTKDTISDILRSAVDGNSGLLFYSHKYVLVRDRSTLNVYERDFNQLHDVEIDISGGCLSKIISIGNGVNLEMSVCDLAEAGKIEFSKGALYFDRDLLSDRLILRFRQDSDKFRPFGMRGVKKLSDYLTDMKIDYIMKDRTPVLLSDNEIIAVIPYRSSDTKKVTSSTKRLLIIRFV